jgi:tetratricopeptide (TPR) repeat protein
VGQAVTADRIDGWKAIGSHFGRDRSTVIRWAAQRGMPVHAIPGGKTRTVYALRSELDAWARRSGESAEPPPPATPQAAAPRRWPAAAAAVLLAGGAAVAYLVPARPTPRTMPHGAQATAVFLKGRDDWARRTRASLAASIVELGQVTRLDPGFAPAFAYLADAYLIEREAGSLPDDVAFARAAAAAGRARRLDPALPAVNRALGFIAYWRDGDRVAAGRLFRRALSGDPDDAQTHFWFANILADNGEDAAAMAEFDRARLLDPGSDDIAADLAWAHWSAGRERQAAAQLAAVVAAHPGNVEAHDCLATVRLAAGDDAGFVAELATRARLRGEPALERQAAALHDALAAGGPARLHRLLVGQARDRAEAAFFASLGGDRPTLLAILQAADAAHETWGSAGYTRRIAARWRGDAQVVALLARRAGPSIGGG